MKLLKVFKKNKNKKIKKFNDDFQRFKSLSVSSGRKMLILEEDLYPCLDDATAATEFDAHYVYHTAWAARRIRQIGPSRHTDISSFLYFSTILSAFFPVQFLDYRPAKVRLSGFDSGEVDLACLPFMDGEVESLSCMHVVEHIGLGRYGDPMDPCGDLTAAKELARVLAVGGLLYFVAPVGRARVCFNAHRIYGYKDVIGMFEGLGLVEFSLIPDRAHEVGIIENADPDLVSNQNYACGCFVFRKEK